MCKTNFHSPRPKDVGQEFVLPITIMYIVGHNKNDDYRVIYLRSSFRHSSEEKLIFFVNKVMGPL